MRRFFKKLGDRYFIVLEYAKKGNLFRFMQSDDGKKLGYSEKLKIFR